MDQAPDETLTYERVEPRLFGVVPQLATFLLGLTILVIALVAVALGHPVLGAVLLVPAIGLLALSVEAARRFGRNDSAPRAALRVREWSGFALASTVARSRASRELLAARSELTRLRAEFRRAQLSLGG